MSTQREEFRPLTSSEKAILEKLLETSFPGRDELAQQLRGLQAKQIDDEGSLKLLVTTKSKANVAQGVVSEAKYPDLDTKGEAGAHVNLLLHVADGKLSMLEIYKDDQSKILKKPNPHEFQLFSR
jgi:hypothetical protein